MNKEIQWLLDEKHNGKESPEFLADVARLKSGEPLAYVIGWVDFLGCRIDLSARPLIPRPETEFWVEQAIAEIRSKHGNTLLRMLDLFSGSGCIGVALAKHLPSVVVDFGEIDDALIPQIKKNIEINNIDPARTKVITTDVFANITDSYDYIFANPPYIDPARFDTVEKSVFLHEPHHALFAGGSGLAFVDHLLQNAQTHLKQGGVMYVEFGKDQKNAVTECAKNSGLEAVFWKDQFSKWRAVRLTLL